MTVVDIWLRVFKRDFLGQSERSATLWKQVVPLSHLGVADGANDRVARRDRGVNFTPQLLEVVDPADFVLLIRQNHSQHPLVPCLRGGGRWCRPLRGCDARRVGDGDKDESPGVCGA
jgi:hypothetical protein